MYGTKRAMYIALIVRALGGTLRKIRMSSRYKKRNQVNMFLSTPLTNASHIPGHWWDQRLWPSIYNIHYGCWMWSSTHHPPGFPPGWRHSVGCVWKKTVAPIGIVIGAVQGKLPNPNLTEGSSRISVLWRYSAAIIFHRGIWSDLCDRHCSSEG